MLAGPFTDEKVRTTQTGRAKKRTRAQSTASAAEESGDDRVVTNAVPARKKRALAATQAIADKENAENGKNNEENGKIAPVYAESPGDANGAMLGAHLDSDDLLRRYNRLVRMRETDAEAQVATLKAASEQRAKAAEEMIRAMKAQVEHLETQMAANIKEDDVRKAAADRLELQAQLAAARAQQAALSSKAVAAEDALALAKSQLHQAQDEARKLRQEQLQASMASEQPVAADMARVYQRFTGIQIETSADEADVLIASVREGRAMFRIHCKQDGSVDVALVHVADGVQLPAFMHDHVTFDTAEMPLFLARVMKSVYLQDC